MVRTKVRARQWYLGRAAAAGAWERDGGGEWPRSYEAQVREGYCQNPVAQRAVKLVAEGVGGAPLVASDPALAALVTARSGGQVLIETVAAHLLLHGNAYVELLCDDAGQVTELFALRPERVTVEADAAGRHAWPVAARHTEPCRNWRSLMPDSTTPRLELPLLAAGQAQKEMSHNEALARIDLCLQGHALEAEVENPPEEPEPGQCWILGAAPTSDWTGHPYEIAGWTAGGWRFVTPREGMRIWLGADAGFALFSEGNWVLGNAYGRVFVDGLQIVGPRGDSITEPTGGVVVDAEARAAIIAVLSAMREHGLVGTD